MGNSTLSIIDILTTLKKKWWLICLCTIIAGSCGFFYTKQNTIPLYTTSSTLYINTTKTSSTSQSPASSSYAKSVINTYIALLRTNSFMQDIAASLPFPYPVEYLKGMVSLSVVPETEMFQIHVLAPEPDQALIIAQKFAELAPKKIMEVRKEDFITVVDPALPAILLSNDIEKNTIISIFLGILFSVGIILLLDLLDKRVKNEDDIIKTHQLPLLGSVPDFGNISILDKQSSSIKSLDSLEGKKI